MATKFNYVDFNTYYTNIKDAVGALSDTDAGADIFTIAHDNLGKLLDGSGVIGSFTNEELIAQMEETNPESFLDACYLQAGDGSDPQFYGVPIMSQALVLEPVCLFA